MFARKSTIPEVHPGRPMICFGPGFLPARSCPGEVHSSIVPAVQSTICFLNPFKCSFGVFKRFVSCVGVNRSNGWAALKIKFSRPLREKNIDDERTGFNKTMVAAVVVCLCVCWIFFAWPRATSFISFRSFHFFSLFSSLAFAKHRKRGSALAKSPAAENILSCGRGLFVAPGFPPTKSGQVTLVLSSSPAQFLRGFSSSPR